MTTKWERRLIALFAALLALLPLLHLIIPDREFSENENRILSRFPTFSFSALLSGEFTSGIESYLSDQFPGRDGWIAMKADMTLLSGRRETGGVYLAGGRLLTRVEEPDQALTARNLEAVRALAEKSSVPVYFTLIPSSAEIYRHLLPFGAPTFDEKALMEQASALPGVLWFSSFPALSLNREEEIYYKTDHHWTTLGAYYGYAAASEAMGFSPEKKPEHPVEVSDSFLGTAYSASGVRFLPSDHIFRAVDEEGISVSVYEDGVFSPGALYHPEALNTKDQYAYFLGGNHPLAVIRTQADGPRLLLLRDSYADCEVPYLAAHFSEIHLIDLRYWRESVVDYLKDAEIDLVLVSYSASHFIRDGNLFLMAH